MTRLALALLLLLAAPAWATEAYRLDATSVQPLGSRWYLFWYGGVVLEGGETARVWLALDACPGGVESIYAHYVKTESPGAWDYQVGWGHPVAYDGYQPDTSVTIVNHSEDEMRFRVKAMVRCAQ